MILDLTNLGQFDHINPNDNIISDYIKRLPLYKELQTVFLNCYFKGTDYDNHTTYNTFQSLIVKYY